MNDNPAVGMILGLEVARHAAVAAGAPEPELSNRDVMVAGLLGGMIQFPMGVFVADLAGRQLGERLAEEQAPAPSPTTGRASKGERPAISDGQGQASKQVVHQLRSVQTALEQRHQAAERVGGRPARTAYRDEANRVTQELKNLASSIRRHTDEWRHEEKQRERDAAHGNAQPAVRE
jgi:hypothetical protein